MWIAGSDGRLPDNQILVRMPEFFMRILLMLNFLIIITMSAFMVRSLLGTVHSGEAAAFLEAAGHVPIEAGKIPVMVVILYSSLVILTTVICNNHWELFAKACGECILVAAISVTLGMGYTGAMFLVIADVIRYKIDWKERALYIVSVSMLYIIMNTEMVWKSLNIIPVDVYWTYYSIDFRGLLTAGFSTLKLINIFVFIFYVVIIALAQMSEADRIYSLNLKLQAANSQLEKYAKESAHNAEIQERNRLAREIHDTIGHSLTGIVTGIEASIMLMDIDAGAAKKQMQAIEEVARAGITDVRQSVRALRPDVLENNKLEDALKKIVNDMRASTGVDIKYENLAHLEGMSEDEEDTVYRIFQESITNSIRHGKATRIECFMRREENYLHITISDNGIGCKDVTQGFGLHHMQERLNLLQGELNYSGENGFVVDVKIPVRWGKEKWND
ncbi:Signal transduction histidine kinase [Lachnospiraceae bacterium]|nr:Signal transduction histidine kinase [Lachnospiraceae bacterium]